MGRISIVDLEVFAKHGVLPEENTLGQKFLVSMEIEAKINQNLIDASAFDKIESTIDYSKVCQDIKSFMENHTFKLIETATIGLAQMVMKEYNQVKSVKVKVKKPWAPIGLPLDTVSFEYEMAWHKVYLGIGSNLGDRESNINTAINIINNDEYTRVQKVSSVIETAPVGNVEQGDFLNAAMEVETLRTPEEFLEIIEEIEKILQRERIVHWGPRTIDVDILLYDDLIMNTEKLTIPHICMHERKFVLAPMTEIAPYAMHPVFNKSMLELLRYVE